MKSSREKQKGFTLLELIIMTFIMLLMASLMIANFRHGEQRKRVNLARDTVVSAIRFAQNQTLAGKQIPRDNTAVLVRGTRCGTDNSILSYWLEFTAATTISVMAQDTCNAVIRISTYNLPDKTIFAAANPYQGDLITTGQFASSTAAIRFAAPFASITATNVANPLHTNFEKANWVRIYVQSVDQSVTETVYFDAISGKIELE